jgi:hypothetical protein
LDEFFYLHILDLLIILYLTTTKSTEDPMAKKATKKAAKKATKKAAKKATKKATKKAAKK